MTLCVYDLQCTHELIPRTHSRGHGPKGNTAGQESARLRMKMQPELIGKAGRLFPGCVCGVTCDALDPRSERTAVQHLWHSLSVVGASRIHRWRNASRSAVHESESGATPSFKTSRHFPSTSQTSLSSDSGPMQLWPLSHLSMKCAAKSRYTAAGPKRRKRGGEGSRLEFRPS